MRANSVAERFWNHVHKTAECWLWTGATRSGGYGVFRDGSRSVSAHRFVWEMEYGAIPFLTSSDGTAIPWLVSHACGNRRCVRPEHLRLLAPANSGELSVEPVQAEPSARPDEVLDDTGAPQRVAGGASETQLLYGLRRWQDSIERGARLSEHLAAAIMAIRSEVETLRVQPGAMAGAGIRLHATDKTGVSRSRLHATDDAEVAPVAQLPAGR